MKATRKALAEYFRWLIRALIAIGAVNTIIIILAGYFMLAVGNSHLAPNSGSDLDGAVLGYFKMFNSPAWLAISIISICLFMIWFIIRFIIGERKGKAA